MFRLQFTNNAMTTLMQSAAAGVSPIYLADVSRLPATISATEPLKLTLIRGADLDVEVVLATAINGNELTVLRGQETTPTRDFVAGDGVHCRITKETLEHFAQDVDQDDTSYARIWETGDEWPKWVPIVPAAGFPEAPTDGLSYARQHTGTPDVYGNANQWTRTQRVYVQATDPAL